MAGGITYGAAKPILATVVENGIDPEDERVLVRTNEATKAILDLIIPVGGCITADVVASGDNGDELFLPKEFENAIEVEPLTGSVYGDDDKPQGFFSITNQFAYVNPDMAHDSPLVDLYLQPDPDDPSILRRKYQYPGLSPNVTVRVTGAKRFIPIGSDNDYLIVQNVLALKDMIMSIERGENNDPTQSDFFLKRCMERLQGEVKKHLLDPMRVMQRKGQYMEDIFTFPENSFAWVRANLALEIPAGLINGRTELGFWLNMAEKRIMQRAMWKDTVLEYESTIEDGQIALPVETQSVLAMDLCGRPIPVRSVFHEYLDNGPGKNSSCFPKLVDEGDGEAIVNGKLVRRRFYRLVGWTAPEDGISQTITFVCKLRWLEKKAADQMIIKNFEALKLMVQAITLEEAEKFDEAKVAQGQAFELMEGELREYLGGIRFAIHVQDYGFGMGRVGGML